MFKWLSHVQAIVKIAWTLGNGFLVYNSCKDQRPTKWAMEVHGDSELPERCDKLWRTVIGQSSLKRLLRWRLFNECALNFSIRAQPYSRSRGDPIEDTLELLKHHSNRCWGVYLTHFAAMSTIIRIATMCIFRNFSKFLSLNSLCKVEWRLHGGPYILPRPYPQRVSAIIRNSSLPSEMRVTWELSCISLPLSVCQSS